VNQEAALDASGIEDGFRVPRPRRRRAVQQQGNSRRCPPSPTQGSRHHGPPLSSATTRSVLHLLAFDFRLRTPAVAVHPPTHIGQRIQTVRPRFYQRSEALPLFSWRPTDPKCRENTPDTPRQ
jgi:hypothetical protein